MKASEAWKEASEKLTDKVMELRLFASEKCTNHREMIVLAQAANLFETLVNYFNFRRQQAQKEEAGS